MSETFIHSVSENQIIVNDLENNNDYDNEDNVFIDSSVYNQECFMEILKKLEDGKPIHEVVRFTSHSSYTHTIVKTIQGLFLYVVLKSVNIYGSYYDFQRYIGPSMMIGTYACPLYRVQYRINKNDSTGAIIKYSNNLDECETYFNHLCKVFNVLTKRLSLNSICCGVGLSDSFYLMNTKTIKKSSRTRISFIIGNSKYSQHRKLDGVINDVNSFYCALLGCSFHSDNIVWLIDSDLRTFYDKWYTFLQLVQSFQSYIEVVVYYAGHGRSDNGNLKLIMTDGNPVQLSIIASTLTESIKNSDSLCLFIVDCCRDGENVLPFHYPIESFDDKKNIAVLFACKYGELSYESLELNAGIFTRSFVKTITERKNNNISTICNLTDIAIKRIYKNYSGCSLIGNFDCSLLEF
ncbi:hypothetical protein DDB_G0293196 [Dictyostelium discoideum AX4]|uniref:Paracaspase n=1 Tax=Dictyostelium discoideum TaxID=44689 RepID=PCP_DICDI|nr:hypothetical protein DDB_G0293196 [Dictyostelium discoideum AX4]Q9GPM2.1 RecName: Full=Paracaspase [Dictyostelium discoideum]AAG38592.1 paracaspase [Dictyostelium discoideum]EAL60797.1 hypothetical protein DDB_G0293196 [Dictyostelium discoideum AX4]|eukprot:XP_629249.1 hypothetical protein DDB_G0293196 [Dictyostelium discoideum AX4]